MKIKKWCRLIVASMLVMLRSGCVKVQITLDVNRDGTVFGTMRALYSSIMMTQDGSDVMDVLNDMKTQFQDQFPEADITIVKPGEVVDYYAGLKIAGIPMEDTMDIVKEGNTITITIPVNRLSNQLLSISGSQEEEMPESALLKSYGFEGMFIVNMPGKPVSNVGMIEKNTVTIDLLDIPKDVDEIVISCKTFNIPLLIGISVGILILIFVVVYFLKKRKS